MPLGASLTPTGSETLVLLRLIVKNRTSVFCLFFIFCGFWCALICFFLSLFLLFFLQQRPSKAAPPFNFLQKLWVLFCGVHVCFEQAACYDVMHGLSRFTLHCRVVMNVPVEPNQSSSKSRLSSCRKSLRQNTMFVGSTKHQGDDLMLHGRSSTCFVRLLLASSVG